MADDRLHLIAEIFIRPALWNFHIEKHKSRATIPELWKEVAFSMGQNVTVDECKRKWKNLRDAYRAEVKRIDMRIESDILKCAYNPKKEYGSKWVYFEHMRFIKDVKRPSRKIINENLNASPSNYTYDDVDTDLDEFLELHNIDGIKIEADDDANTEQYKIDKENNAADNQMITENFSKDVEKHNQAQTENSSPPRSDIKINLLNQDRLKAQETKPNVDLGPSCFKCSKRSYDQMDFLEDLKKEEQNLIKATRLDITRSNVLDHVGDSDYNFLVSFLPQLKKFNDLQNLQFRAKITDLMFNIMSQSISNSITPLSAE